MKNDTQISLTFLLKQQQQQTTVGQGGSNSLAITCNYVKEGGQAGEEGVTKTPIHDRLISLCDRNL